MSGLADKIVTAISNGDYHFIRKLAQGGVDFSTLQLNYEGENLSPLECLTLVVDRYYYDSASEIELMVKALLEAKVDPNQGGIFLLSCISRYNTAACGSVILLLEAGLKIPASGFLTLRWKDISCSIAHILGSIRPLHEHEEYDQVVYLLSLQGYRFDYFNDRYIVQYRHEKIARQLEQITFENDMDSLKKELVTVRSSPLPGDLFLQEMINDKLVSDNSDAEKIAESYWKFLKPKLVTRIQELRQ